MTTAQNKHYQLPAVGGNPGLEPNVTTPGSFANKPSILPDVRGAKKKTTNRHDAKYDATNAAAAANRRASMNNWTGGFATPTGPTATTTQKKKPAAAAAPAKKKGWFGFSP